MARERARLSTGTRSPLKAMLRRLGLRGRTPEKDIADLDAGRTFKVMSLSKSITGGRLTPAGRAGKVVTSRSGTLYLTAGRPPAWEERTAPKRRVELAGPLELRGEGDPVPPLRRWRRYELVAAGTTHDLILPVEDVALVRHALSTVAAEPAAR